jgi:hypothetical protein
MKMSKWIRDPNYDWYSNDGYPNIIIRPDPAGGYMRWQVIRVIPAEVAAHKSRADVLSRHRLLADAKKSVELNHNEIGGLK